MTKSESKNVTRTIAAWRKLGIEINWVPVNVSKNPRKLRYQSRILFRGEQYTRTQFAKKFPYAANPST